jgi:hypothetical protein
MEIFDAGKKRGSRIFFKTGVDMVFSGVSFIGAYEDDETDHGIYELNKNGGAFFFGIDWDLFFGGTFPKTDFIWGFGCIWTFLFPVYSPKYDVNTFFEPWHFYATPTILFGYDLKIPNSNFKLTPQIKVGITCNPLIPDDLIRDMITVGGKYFQAEQYSGLYIDLSLAFSFVKITWRNK